MTRETMRDMMQDADEAVKPHLIANNTVEYTRPDGRRVVRLHHTDILEFGGKSVTLNTGGWKTVTTKDRLNRFQGDVQIYSKRGIWYVSNASGEVPYFDGMTIRNGRLPKGGSSEASHERALAKSISAYCKKLSLLPKLPEPNGGDCWGCAMQDKNGKTFMGSDCLREHLREKYIHGSLIVNAMRWAGYQDAAIGMAYQGVFPRSSVTSAVRRYFRRNLGLAT